MGVDGKREAARSFQDLIIWRKAHEFVLIAYKLSKTFPSDERFGLTSQFRRAAISIPATSRRDFASNQKRIKRDF
jgi:four helix bundle protein